MLIFGEELRRLRLNKTEYTLREFAKVLGVTPGYVSNVENGSEPPFSDELLEKVSQLLDLSSQEKEQLFILKQQGKQQVRAEKAVYEFLRQAQHLTPERINEIYEEAKGRLTPRRSLPKYKNGL